MRLKIRLVSLKEFAAELTARNSVLNANTSTGEGSIQLFSVRRNQLYSNSVYSSTSFDFCINKSYYQRNKIEIVTTYCKMAESVLDEI